MKYRVDSLIIRELKSRSEYFRTFSNEAYLAGWIQTGGSCCYCARYLLKAERLAECETEHILPKQIYPQLDVDPLNLALACKTCRNTKFDWDPNESEYQRGEMTQELRTLFLDRARSRVQKRIRSFPEPQSLSVAKYHEAEQAWKEIIGCAENLELTSAFIPQPAPVNFAFKTAAFVVILVVVGLLLYLFFHKYPQPNAVEYYDICGCTAFT